MKIGNIEFKNVSFEYPDDHNRVFKDLNFSIKKGEKIAFVGPSGGGKTTLCNLIPRFYDVTDGEIFLDGKNVKKYTLKSLRKSIGMVQQDVYLFSGTVYENIAFAMRVIGARENAIRKQLTLLFLSYGIPMIQIGDIIAHTKNGNNIKYILYMRNK
mgnify:CR=1 FL=1